MPPAASVFALPLREASLRYRAWIAVLAAVLVVMAAGWAVVGYRRKLRRRDGQLSESLALLDSYRESHDSLTSRLDASNAREAAVKRLLEGRVAAVRDIAATCYTFGEGERLTDAHDAQCFTVGSDQTDFRGVDLFV